MPDLVTLAELKVYLGDAPASADDALLTALLDDVEALFESATLRAPGFYTAAATGVTEYLDGTGCKRLYLTYPIDVLTSITLGYATTETLDLTSRSAVVYGQGSRVVTRTDGGWFGCVGQARYVAVVYDHLGNLPADAQLAIKSVVSSVYRNRGSEGMKSETVGSFYSYTRDDLATATATDPFWQQAVINNSPAVLA
jgi:hypothetical protein